MSNTFRRDERSKALINIDESVLSKRKLLREKMNQQEKLFERVSSLEEEVSSLKELVERILLGATK